MQPKDFGNGTCVQFIAWLEKERSSLWLGRGKERASPLPWSPKCRCDIEYLSLSAQLCRKLFSGCDCNLPIPIKRKERNLSGRIPHLNNRVHSSATLRTHSLPAWTTAVAYLKKCCINNNNQADHCAEVLPTSIIEMHERPRYAAAAFSYVMLLGVCGSDSRYDQLQTHVNFFAFGLESLWSLIPESWV